MSKRTDLWPSGVLFSRSKYTLGTGEPTTLRQVSQSAGERDSASPFISCRRLRRLDLGDGASVISPRTQIPSYAYAK